MNEILRIKAIDLMSMPIDVLKMTQYCVENKLWSLLGIRNEVEKYKSIICEREFETNDFILKAGK